MTKKHWPRWCGDCRGERPYGQEFCPACAGKRAEVEAQREADEREKEREAYERTDAFKIEQLASTLGLMNAQMNILNARIGLLAKRLDRLEEAPFHED